MMMIRRPGADNPQAQASYEASVRSDFARPNARYSLLQFQQFQLVSVMRARPNHRTGALKLLR
jgi:hypothetical protein